MDMMTGEMRMREDIDVSQHELREFFTFLAALTTFLSSSNYLCIVTPMHMQPSLLQIQAAPTLKQMPPSSDLIFGHTFTDHMLMVPWTHGTGWGAPVIKPYGPLALDPSSTVLHYASTLFEGMKAYRDATSGTVRLFRPDKNMERMNKSAARLAFPVC